MPTANGAGSGRSLLLRTVPTEGRASAIVTACMVYTHVLNRGGRGVHSPLDRLRMPVSGEIRRMMRTGR